MAKEPSLQRRIRAIGQTRSIAVAALKSSLTGIDQGLSESTIHERWQIALADNSSLMPQGWYLPPPAGISVLVGQPPHYARTSFESLRDQSRWPDRQSQFQTDSLLFLYASPVDRDTAMIGDFQITIYSGSDRTIKDHIATCFMITVSIASYAAVGMEIRELYDYGARLIESSGLINSTHSTTDASGHANIGHTVPWSYQDYDQRIWSAIRAGNIQEVANLIRHAKVLLTADETLRITDNIAFTVEPQITTPGLPKVSFHVIVSFCDGIKRVSANYADLISFFGMTEYLPPDSVRKLTENDPHG